MVGRLVRVTNQQFDSPHCAGGLAKWWATSLIELLTGRSEGLISLLVDFPRCAGKATSPIDLSTGWFVGRFSALRWQVGQMAGVS